MNARSFFVASISVVALASGSLLAGCGSTPESTGVQAVNLSTGETDTFESQDDVPVGWAECGEAGCPEPYPCVELDEASCLVREDCAPLHDVEGAFAGCSDAAATCDEAECGPQPGAPNYLCDDGSVGGFTGRCLQNGSGCGWEMRECPAAIECDPSECGPQPGMPAYTCDDGSVGGFTGRCLQGEAGCGWEILDCPGGD